MTPMDPLADLRDIRMPAEPSWWPPAPGWWVVALAALVLVAVVAWRAWRIHRRGRPARAARRELASIEADFAADRDSARAARRVSALLRRYLLARFERARVAGLAGGDWAGFVQRCVGGERRRLDAILGAPYRADGGEVGELTALARKLIRATSRRGADALAEEPDS